MIHRQLWTFWANLDRHWMSSTSPERWPCEVGFAKNLARFTPKTSVQNYLVWAERYANIINYLIQRLSKIIFFTASIFSSVVDMIRRPERASPLTSSRSSLNRLYHTQLNLCSANSRPAKRQHLKCPFTFNLNFYTKTNTVSTFQMSFHI